MKPGAAVAKSGKKAGKSNAGAAGSGAPAATPKKEKEKRPPVKVKGPIVVGERDEEYEHVQRETCHCGGGYEIEMEEIRPASESSGPLDILKTLCVDCGSRVDFQFDISSFYDGSESEFEFDEGAGGSGDDEGGWLS
ncbi:MAG TPA: hypothetical protein VGB42_07820 [Candidatus Thermoplasmatota archaeon]